MTQLGEFILGAPLGQGGWGRVFSATHVTTGVDVALKVVPSGSGDLWPEITAMATLAADRPDEVERLRRELMSLLASDQGLELDIHIEFAELDFYRGAYASANEHSEAALNALTGEASLMVLGTQLTHAKCCHALGEVERARQSLDAARETAAVLGPHFAGRDLIAETAAVVEDDP